MNGESWEVIAAISTMLAAIAACYAAWISRSAMIETQTELSKQARRWEEEMVATRESISLARQQSEEEARRRRLEITLPYATDFQKELSAATGAISKAATFSELGLLLQRPITGKQFLDLMHNDGLKDAVYRLPELLTDFSRPVVYEVYDMDVINQVVGDQYLAAWYICKPCLDLRGKLAASTGSLPYYAAESLADRLLVKQGLSRDQYEAKYGQVARWLLAWDHVMKLSDDAVQRGEDRFVVPHPLDQFLGISAEQMDDLLR